MRYAWYFFEQYFGSYPLLKKKMISLVTENLKKWDLKTLDRVDEFVAISRTIQTRIHDIYKRDSLWGQIDYWTRTIRIYDNDRRLEDIFHSLLHEVLHGISSALKLKLRDENMHDELDILSLALTDVIFRNGWIMQKDGNLYGEQKREDIR